MKFRASDVKVMFIIITCIRTIIIIYRRILQYRKCGARSGSPQLVHVVMAVEAARQAVVCKVVKFIFLSR